MKNILYIIILFVFVQPISLLAADIIIKEGSWVISLNENTKKIEVKYKDLTILSEMFAEVKYTINNTGQIADSYNYPNITLLQKNIKDNFGTGKQYTLEYSGLGGTNLNQSFYFYNELSYFLTEVSLVNNSESISSNYLAPIVSLKTNSFLPASSSNRMLWVPWDNDAWVRYQSYEMNSLMISHEVSAIFCGDSRKGLIAGSIEHDIWKSGVEVSSSNNHDVDKFSCFSGYTSEYSRDVLPHGKVTGKEVKSAKFMFGYFDDWRIGMNEYGKANTKIVAGLHWDGGTPFGWSSWGSMQDKISYAGICDVSDFLKNELYDLDFHDAEGKTVMSLDAFWNDNITSFSMKQFATRCKDRNQIAGIYYGPFCDWNGDPERVVEGSDGKYKYKDIWLKVNGKEHRQGGICLDPTHPGTKMAMVYNLERYKSWGYKYIKVDFVTDGAIEADSYYNPEVTTGTQAYNEGMQYMRDLIANDMYIVLAISPIFPYQYAHGRRTCCDSYSQINETEYVMNSTSFGWWTNEFYQVNDPDHLVMLSNSGEGKESYGTNRARVTSGAVTGAFLFGDNFSPLVDKGYPAQSRERAKLFMTNKDVNDIVRNCGSFMPVEGYKAKTSGGAENLLMYNTDKYTYMACINYNSVILSVSGNMPFERLGIDPGNVESIKELWSGSDISIKNNIGFDYRVAAADACIYRIKKKNSGSNIENLKENTSPVKISQISGLLILNSYELMKKISIYNTHGILIKESNINLMRDTEFDVSSIFQGVYVIKIDFDNSVSYSCKMILK